MKFSEICSAEIKQPSENYGKLGYVALIAIRTKLFLKQLLVNPEVDVKLQQLLDKEERYARVTGVKYCLNRLLVIAQYKVSKYIL